MLDAITDTLNITSVFKQDKVCSSTSLRPLLQVDSEVQVPSILWLWNLPRKAFLAISKGKKREKGNCLLSDIPFISRQSHTASNYLQDPLPMYGSPWNIVYRTCWPASMRLNRSPACVSLVCLCLYNCVCYIALQLCATISLSFSHFNVSFWLTKGVPVYRCLYRIL